jgi:putrescine aminotransferase
MQQRRRYERGKYTTWMAEVPELRITSGFKLVSDKATRQSLFDRLPNLRKDISRYARQKHGVIIAIHGGAVALTPPLVITAAEVTRVVYAVGDVLARVNLHTGAIDRH